MNPYDPYWITIWKQFKKRKLGMAALFVVLLFCLMGVFAPFLASSKPIVVQYRGEWYFPLFRYLFYTGFFTKRLDIFFNLLIFTLPAGLLLVFLLKRRSKLLLISLSCLLFVQCFLFLYFVFGKAKDPAVNVTLNQERRWALKSHPLPDWNFELKYMNAYAKLNLILRYQQRKRQHERLENDISAFAMGKMTSFPTLWQLEVDNEKKRLIRAQDRIDALVKRGEISRNAYSLAEAEKRVIEERHEWLVKEVQHLHYEVMPLVSAFHWEDDAGGSQSLNLRVSFLDLTRINRKNLVAALIFGIRISLVVGVLAVAIALSIALPIGSFAGYYGGKTDIIASRFLEVWESMPTFFMLLLVVAIMQSKSIFLVIIVIGLFGWTTFSRFIRGEFFKQRNLPYVEACRAIGLNDKKIMFSHILPNAMPPVLTLLPFSIMGAITSEAGLSFLGLGEEGSCSWGVLMDEGRTAFPAESYLLWPPAIMLIVLLIAIALVGDTLRDSLDPKMHR